jgi:hypothetical protein
LGTPVVAFVLALLALADSGAPEMPG